MHSAEPFDRRSVSEPSQPAPEDGAWRAEVAARVNSYRARHKSIAGEQVSLTFETGSAARAQSSNAGNLGSANLATAILQPANAGARDLHNSRRASTPGDASSGAFDTHYYRRLNAQSLSAMTMAATTAAAQQEPEAGDEADTAAATPAAAGSESRAQEMASPAIDLELHPAARGDAGLERYRIQNLDSRDLKSQDLDSEDAEPETLFEAVRAPSGAAPVAAPVFPPQGNLIAFPRPLLEPPLLPLPSRDELAEPVNPRPRILEVPEDIMPAMQGSLFPEIRLDVDEPEDCARHEPRIEALLPVAPLSERLMASLADLAVVITAGALFAAIACRALPGVPHTKPFWMALAGATMLLWAVYQHLFLLYAGRTVGMSMRGIHLSTFDGRVPGWAERRRRARFIFISFASVALGFLWALVDEDALCWHDRVSRTFPTTG